jgi:predicted alpha/beta-hydrolase family hydrolase
MNMTQPQALRLEVEGAGSVSALALEPVRALAALVLAHGAGAGMTHAFMQQLAEGLAARGIATLRWQFPYMERGSKRVDPPVLAQAAVRAAVAEAARRWPALPRLAGGKSFGARMTSQAEAAAPLPGVRGLVFVGFPLHPAGAPGITRAEHLDAVRCPMLFLQGTRDALADMVLVAGVCARLAPRAALVAFEAADHAFHVRDADVRAGARGDTEVMQALLDATAAWIVRCPPR